MIEEAYVSFEVAKLLKEKGFDEYCRYFYDCETPNTGYLSNKRYGEDIHNSKVYDGRNLAACPTHQMAMGWLRETYGIDIVIEISDPSVKDRKYYCMIWDGNNNSYILDLFNTYEDAVEAALKYCLGHLI